jgi:uncharacterized protein YndB with AHSA1/START domain
MDGSVISVERVIDAPADPIFDLVADAAHHPEIDGSGTVRRAKGPSRRLALGSTFGMAMRLGVPYSMVSTVIELDENRRIAWQTRPPGFPGRFIGGRIWRYELEPVVGGTLVRETWDISQDHQRALLRLGPTPRRTTEGMTKTLERIESIVTES